MDTARRPPLTMTSVIAALTASLLLATIGSAQLFNFRERARVSVCQNNLKQLALALINYETTRSALPGYVVAQNRLGKDDKFSRPLLYEILPQLERSDIYEAYSRETHAKDGMPEVHLAFVICPTAALDLKPTGALSHYTYNTGMPDVKADKFPPDWPANGVFQQQKSISLERVRDGLSNTLLLSERAEGTKWNSMEEREISFVWNPKFKDQPWAKINGVAAKAKSTDGKSPEAKSPADSKTADHKTADSKPGDAKSSGKDKLDEFKPWMLARPSSKHGKNVNVAFADGYVRALRDSIDYKVYAALLTPDGKRAKYAGSDEPVEKEFTDYILNEKDFK